MQVVLAECILFHIGEFIIEHAHLEAKKLDPPNPVSKCMKYTCIVHHNSLQQEVFRMQYVQSFDQVLAQRTVSVVSQCKAWMLLAESRMQTSLMINESNPLLQSQLLELYGNIGAYGVVNVEQIISAVLKIVNSHDNVSDNCKFIQPS